MTKSIIKIIKILFITLLVIILVIPMGLYVAISLPPIQKKLCQIGENELTNLLGTTVNIESIDITPFNHLSLNNITIDDDNKSNALKISTLGAGIDLYELIKNNQIVISHATIIGLDAKLYKKNASSPINIQNIIENLKPKDKSKSPTKFDLRINTIVIRGSQFSYDVLSAKTTKNKFDKNHINVTDFNADIFIPQLKNDDFIIDIRRMQAKEHSGLVLSNLIGDFHIASTGLNIKDFELSLQNSKIAFSDINLSYKNWDNLNDVIKNPPLNVSIINGSHITLRDIGPFVPILNNINEQFNIDLSLSGYLDNLSIKNLNIAHSSKKIKATILGGGITNIKDPNLMNIVLPSFNINALSKDLNSILIPLNILKPNDVLRIAQLGDISISGQFNGTLADAKISSNVLTSAGNANIDLNYMANRSIKGIVANGTINTKNLNIGSLFNDRFGTTNASCNFNININKNSRHATINSDIKHIDFNGYRYNNILANASMDNDYISGDISIIDPNLQFTITGNANINKSIQSANIHADIPIAYLDKINLTPKYYTFSSTIDANITGFDIDNTNGNINISDIIFSNNPDKYLFVDNISINAINNATTQQISISSKPINAMLSGSYSFNNLLPAIKDILSHSFPAIFEKQNRFITSTQKNSKLRDNDFSFNLTINKDDDIFNYFNINTKLFLPITVNGNINHPSKKLNLNINIPYLVQKNKLIENTFLSIDIDQSTDKCQLLAHSELPTKHGSMPIDISCNGIDNRLDTYINWKINRNERFEGFIDFSTLFTKDDIGNLSTDFDINPSKLIFNDSIWNIHQAKIHYSDKNLEIANFDIRHADQFITLSGKASPSTEDILFLNLKNVNLDYIFQTLEINNVLLGGDASGTFYASGLFSKKPSAYTPGLNVKNISYNSTILGDANISAHWDNEQQAVCLDALINQEDGNKSRIYGEIYPMKEALDLKFNANKINVGFMKTYMSAFASDVQGYASGKARLYGTFKYIDMIGDIYAQDLKLKIGFTNTYYSATDSIHLTPGFIDIKNITLKDPSGNTALLNGWVSHKFFKEPEFSFNITNANNFLCYDIPEITGEKWFGHINGNGFARIDGKPGVVNIYVEMETAPKSAFTFIISDLENAYDYKFLTFRDKNSLDKESAISPNGNEPIEVTKFKENAKKVEEISSSIYNMNIIVDVTPNAQITLVMDPIGGDKIKATGKGQLKMSYSSSNEDLKMYGTYEIDEGSYNFTLQDIILKDFKIRNDSRISFEGNPFAAKLDIDAVYPVKANLSDLDESFLEDKSVNNTNVPIDVIFNINGVMTQPDINYKLEFPSFVNSKSDIESKVNSIVSTEDMMKRQCLYLLALNRFYTPEYMTTTNGSELFSVASSTLSSQLSSMLGQLSDNWSIAPNLRSDLGDFSDVEVDVALSSSLLNNRLRFNGNFGYRDKTLNTNQFIGDFDLEYLLNPRGSWRLKAYNRYNDQNYYLKTATTTQGVGIMYRQDFDNMFAFLKNNNKNKNNNHNDSENPIDSIFVDSITPTKPTIIPDSTVTVP